MASKKRARAKLTSALKRARTDRKRLAKKVEAARAKLEKRTRKLQAREAEVAKLERRAYLPGAAESDQAPEEDKNLRPARLIYNPKSGGNVKDAHPLEKIVGMLRALWVDVRGREVERVREEIVTEAVAQHHRARLGGIDLVANDDVSLKGERIRLNAPEPGEPRS